MLQPSQQQNWRMVIARHTHEMDIERVEKLVQLGVGVVCVFALIAFSYLEFINPGQSISDRLFWTLVAISASGLALSELRQLLRFHVGSSGSDTDDNSGSEEYRRPPPPEMRERRSWGDRDDGRDRYGGDETDSGRNPPRRRPYRNSNRPPPHHDGIEQGQTDDTETEGKNEG